MPRGEWELSGFLGIRGFSSRSALGAVDGNDAWIAGTVAFGARLGYWLRPGLTAEGELPLALSSGRGTGEDVKIAVIEPRAHLRLESVAPGRIAPFAVLGLGIPVALSTKRYVIDSDIQADLYVGAGVRFAGSSSGWNLRVDARAILMPARGVQLGTGELALSVSLYRALGAAGGAPAPRARVDLDGDGVQDEDDLCPERAEDRDGFEDHDGCPDIDDDGDEVLDVADRCRLDPETRNGYRDQDGCPDKLPEALRVLVPKPEALLFMSGSVALRAPARAALEQVARLLAEHESVRLLIIGHTDDREAPDDAEELSSERAEVARELLIEQGIQPWRLEVWGSGATDPVADNGNARGRLRNRRVDLQIWISGQPIHVQATRPAAPDSVLQSSGVDR